MAFDIVEFSLWVSVGLLCISFYYAMCAHFVKKKLQALADKASDIIRDDNLSDEVKGIAVEAYSDATDSFLLLKTLYYGVTHLRQSARSIAIGNLQAGRAAEERKRCGELVRGMIRVNARLNPLLYIVLIPFNLMYSRLLRKCVKAEMESIKRELMMTKADRKRYRKVSKSTKDSWSTWQAADYISFRNDKHPPSCAA